MIVQLCHGGCAKDRDKSIRWYLHKKRALYLLGFVFFILICSHSIHLNFVPSSCSSALE